MRLITQSTSQPSQSFPLNENGSRTVGRSPDADITITTEPALSRNHATITPMGDNTLHVARNPNATNPIIYKGEPTDAFTMQPGDVFVIGETTFQFEPATATTSDNAPQFAHTMPADEVRPRERAGDRMRLIDLMELPVVLRTKSRSEFFNYAAGCLRLATNAGWVQVLRITAQGPEVLSEDAKLDQTHDKTVSTKLITEAINKAPSPVTYCWSNNQSGKLQATVSEGVDWAIGCAMPIPGEDPIILYVAGQQQQSATTSLDTPITTDLSLRDMARLVGLIADMIGRTMSLEKMESWKTRLGHFFSDKVTAKILEEDAEQALAPKITEATVMFFDIRGFSLRTERNLDRIMEFTAERKRVLTAMSQAVFDHDGVIISYAGDGILACWNVPSAINDHVDKACEAAITMTQQMKNVTDGWDCGIGLGCGNVVAGSLGSDQVYAFDILGAVVNQTARVEGITKIVGVDILVTKEVAQQVHPDRILTRRVARFQPAGMEEVVELYTVSRTPDDTAQRQTLIEQFAIHANGLSAFEGGNWEEAFSLLHPIVERDAAARYVYKLAIQGKPPKDWRGVIELSSK